jgi:hypothetical protein
MLWCSFRFLPIHFGGWWCYQRASFRLQSRLGRDDVQFLDLVIAMKYRHWLCCSEDECCNSNDAMTMFSHGTHSRVRDSGPSNTTRISFFSSFIVISSSSAVIDGIYWAYPNDDPFTAPSFVVTASSGKKKPISRREAVRSTSGDSPLRRNLKSRNFSEDSLRVRPAGILGKAD